MIKKEIVNIQKEVITDVICDICGNTCSRGEMVDVVGMEYMTLEANWGYFSNKDLENWKAEICEPCVDKHLSPIIKFLKRSSISGEIL